MADHQLTNLIEFSDFDPIQKSCVGMLFSAVDVIAAVGEGRTDEDLNEDLNNLFQRRHQTVSWFNAVQSNIMFRANWSMDKRDMIDRRSSAIESLKQSLFDYCWKKGYPADELCGRIVGYRVSKFDEHKYTCFTDVAHAFIELCMALVEKKMVEEESENGQRD